MPILYSISCQRMYRILFQNNGMMMHLTHQYQHNTQPPQLSQLYGCNKENTITSKFHVNNISANAHMLWQILKLQSTFHSSNFPFYNTSTRTNARHTIDTRPPSFALTPLSILIFLHL